MEFLIECMDDLSMEQQKVRHYFLDLCYTSVCDYYLAQQSLNKIGFAFAVPILLPQPFTPTISAASLATKEEVFCFV